MYISTWPSNPERSARLRAFLASSLAVEKPESLSPFWEQHGEETIPEERRIIVRSGFSFAAPGERIQERQVPGPRALWRLAARIIPGIARSVERRPTLQLARLARDAFSAGPAIGREPDELPPYAELLHTRSEAALPIYRYASSLNSLAPYVDRPGRGLEIGSGSGLLALGICRLLGCRQAVLVDLPGMLPVAFTVLTHFEGDEAVTLPNEVGDRLPGSRYVLLAPSQTPLIGTASVDLVVNTSSFQEMTYEGIGEYFDLIDRVAVDGAVFYSMNEEACRKGPGDPIEFDRYPWRESWDTEFDRPFAFWNRITGVPHRERLDLVRRPS